MKLHNYSFREKKLRKVVLGRTILGLTSNVYSDRSLSFCYGPNILSWYPLFLSSLKDFSRQNYTDYPSYCVSDKVLVRNA